MHVFDIESDGLLEDVTTVHCINVIDRFTGKSYAFNSGMYADGSFAPHDGSIEDGLKMLEEAECIAGQKIIEYDIPALKKLFPKWKPKGRIFDSLPASRVIWANVADNDFIALKKGLLPDEFRSGGLIGKHGLEAWGMRLGELKGDFKPGNYTNPATGEPHTWKTIGFTPEMDKYGRQDPRTTLKLIEKIESKQYSTECLDLEHRVAEIIFQQTERGFAFDVDAAMKLAAKLLKRHAEIEAELTTLFQPWYAKDVAKGTCLMTPKKKRREWVVSELGTQIRKYSPKTQKSDERGYYVDYAEGAAYSKVKLVVFNPASRDHISDRLMTTRGWMPSTFTPEGKPQVDETTLESLPWPEAKVLAEYLMVEKRLGQVANGKQAWLKHATKTGLYGIETDGVFRIHGGVNPNGAVTGRMTHSAPNVAQTPAVGAPYGEECRACFIATPGLKLVGCDAEGLELRFLAHFMAIYDNGAYVETVVNGQKELGTDVHTVNQKAVGLNLRDSAKTFIYALIYGAGDYKLGTIVYDDFDEATKLRFNLKYRKKNQRATALKSLGGDRRKRIMTNLPALGKLVEAVKDAAKRGYLKGLDGRKLHVRAEHSALNTLLQSGGALVMKKALVLLDDVLNALRAKGVMAAFVANIHDEWQIEVTPEYADEVGKLAADAIKAAGEYFKLLCPLAGSFSVGTNWKETH